MKAWPRECLYIQASWTTKVAAQPSLNEDERTLHAPPRKSRINTTQNYRDGGKTVRPARRQRSMDRPSRLPDEYETYHLEAHDPRAPRCDVPPVVCAPVRYVLGAVHACRLAAREAIGSWWSWDKPVGWTDRNTVVALATTGEGTWRHACTECVHQWRLEMRQMHTSWSAHWEISVPGILRSLHSDSEAPLSLTILLVVVVLLGSHSISSSAVLSHHRLARIKLAGTAGCFHRARAPIDPHAPRPRARRPEQASRHHC